MPTFPKPEKRKRTQARKARTEAAVKKAVREACVLRDGFCRLGWEHRIAGTTRMDVDPICSGPSEWAHLPPWTRARTKNLALDVRHSTQSSIMLCRTHHDLVDGRRKPNLLITPTTPAGADGPLEVRVTR